MYTQIVLLVVLATAQGQLTSNGSCNFENQIPIDQIDSGSLPDKMYEISRINNNWQSGQCASWSLRRNNDSSALSAVTVQMTEVVNRTLVEKNATAALSSVDNTTILVIDFDDFSSNFTVLGLSNEYLLLYACSNQGENKLEYVWRLSPNTSLSEAAINETDKILSNNNLVVSWTSVSHSTESCKTGGAASLKISSFIVLLVGFALLKGF